MLDYEIIKILLLYIRTIGRRKSNINVHR